MNTLKTIDQCQLDIICGGANGWWLANHPRVAAGFFANRPCAEARFVTNHPLAGARVQQIQARWGI